LWALDKAFMKGMPEIFNSDQGSQFTNEAFTDRLATAGVRSDSRCKNQLGWSRTCNG